MMMTRHDQGESLFYHSILPRDSRNKSQGRGLDILTMDTLSDVDTYRGHPEVSVSWTLPLRVWLSSEPP